MHEPGGNNEAEWTMRLRLEFSNKYSLWGELTRGNADRLFIASDALPLLGTEVAVGIGVNVATGVEVKIAVGLDVAVDV